ncbi:MAG: hypothetical protein BRD55_10815 [Bacteroidetes bacterium SW_9_63_38]|nr:MAG: hypothetical protein BRD55_10815 [Bacteroidetes bacterium SW_9_63_38]
MLHQRSLLFLLFVGLLAGAPLSASAQSVGSVVGEMRARYQKQLETIDTYIVETNLYTSYHKKVTENGEPTYKSQTKMKKKSSSSLAAGTTPSSAYGLQHNRLKQNATYGGTETVNDAPAHVLKVKAPSKVNPEMKKGDAESMTYYIDAKRYVPSRLLMNTKGSGGGGSKTSSVTVNMKDYQTVDGLTLPYRMEFQFNMDMTEEEKKKMAMMIKRMENMPEEESERMKQMMGSQIDMMKQMLSGDPIVVEVQDVKVNTEIPAGVF